MPNYPLVGQPPDRFPFGTDRFPFGVVLSRTSSLLELVMDAERTWLNFGGKCGFYVSGATVRGSLPEGEVAYELTERIIWHYFDENTGPIPKTSSFESVYEQLSHCYRGILEACKCVDDLVSLGGDELTPVIYELEWPEGLLYLGLKNSHPLLRVERGLLARSLPGEELIPFGDETGECHDVFRICPSSVARATSYALKALRRMVHAVDAPAAGGEATPEAPRVPSRSITAYDDEVKRAAKEDFHPSLGFLEPLFREIESIIDSDSCIGKDKLHALRMLFWNLTNAEVRLYFDGNPDWETYRSDARPAAWERARHWLLAARLTGLCDDFKDRTVRQKEAIDTLWQEVGHSPGRQLTADDFIDLELDAYLGTLQSLSLTLRQHTPVTTTTQTPNAPAAGEGDDNRQPPAAKPGDAAGGGVEKGTTWQTAQAYMEQCRQRSEGFTSQDDFAKRLECSSSTVNKAINRGTVELQEWAAKQSGASRLNVSPEAAAVALEKTPQSREPDPGNAIEQPDVDAALRFLIEQARRKSPEAAAETEICIQAMDPAARRSLAELTYDDPDKAEQIERHRRAEKMKPRD